jgi:tetratricopeptide (TPR) repeat protein
MQMKFSARSLRRLPAPLLALFLSCSTYFNMFYNAETSFDEAQRIQAKVMRNFPDSIVVEPSADARAKYDRAIEKASKVMEVYPKNRKWHDDAFFLLGKSYFYEKEMGKAIRWLRQLQEEFPQSPFIPESYVYLAKALIVDDNLAKAEETLKFALDRYPFLDKDQAISFLLIELAIRREGKSQAIATIERIGASVRSEEKRLDLQLRAAELYMDLRQYDRAIALLQKAPRSKKSPAREYRIDRDMVSCYAATDSLVKALDLLKRMLADNGYAPYKKQILFVKGTILVGRGDIDSAIAVYEQIVGGAKGDTLAIKADTSLVINKAFYALGQLYQKRKGNYKEAERYFRAVSERQVQDPSVNPLAVKRLNAIKGLQELRAADTGRDTSGQHRLRLFKAGELFYYELDEPDSAYAQYMSIVNDTAVDSLVTPKAVYAAAYVSRSDFSDTVRSDSLYGRLIARFPWSDFVGRARDEMTVPPAIKTRKELAAEAFRNAEKEYLGGGEAKAAVQAFYNVYREYSDIEIAQKSLFVTAWLTDNELQKKKVAKSLYEKLCDRYPGSLYCTKEAQPRIKVVLDTLEALRQERKKSEQGPKPATDTAAAKQARRPDSTSAPGIAADSLLGGPAAKDSVAKIRLEAAKSAGPTMQDPSVPLRHMMPPENFNRMRPLPVPPDSVKPR